MRRNGQLFLFVFHLSGVFLLGCSSQTPEKKGDPRQAEVVVVPDDQKKQPNPILLPANLGGKELTPGDQEKFDAAVSDAIQLQIAGKYSEALAALETANGIKDSEFVKTAIEKIRLRLEQQNAANKAVEDIQTVLAQGESEKAGELTTAALQQFGGSDTAPQLSQLKLQSDALNAAPLKNDVEKFNRFRDEGNAALKENNLRAAVLAFAQALQYGHDPQVKEDYDALRSKLQTYDDKRQQVAELRKDPSRLEEVRNLLQEAGKVWDTLQVRQDLDEILLALQNRRDRLTVADFEVRGEVGIPVAGRTIPEELLPLFKSRFDLVERSQLGKVLDELKLEAAQLGGDGEQQKQVGQVAKVRYLVLGSITPLAGITIHARLVDVQTGLIVQTAKVVAATPEEALAALPLLAKLLQMSDEERLAWDAAQAKQAQGDSVAAVDPNTPLPPPPEPPQADQPLPPPEPIITERPPELGGIQIKDLDGLPPPAEQLPPIADGGAQEDVVKRRFLQISLTLGDNLFRRGRFREAHRHFEFALQLAPGNFDLRLRVDRNLQYLPPPPPVMLVLDAPPPPPPPPPPPRIAFVDFVVMGDPDEVAPALSWWTPRHLAPYFSPPFEVVDRDELFWYMSRAGLSVRDLITDPYARRWLGRALNIRYFVLGSIRQTNSFVVTTHLLDAEYGYRQGMGQIYVRNRHELKLRFGELAQLTLMSPEQRLAYLNQGKEFDGLLQQAQEQRAAGRFEISISLCRKALKLRPGNIQVNVFLQRDDGQARQLALEAARRAEWERMQNAQQEFQRRQLELARQAEAARIFAAQREAALSEQQKALREQQRLLANQRLLLQANLALKAKNFQLSVQLYESALTIRRDDDVFRQLAQARLEAQRSAEERVAAERALRLEAERKQREAELTAVRAQLELERVRRLNEEKARKKLQDQVDQLAFQRNFEAGQKLLLQEKYDAALAALQAAQRIRPSPMMGTLVNQALLGQAKAKGGAEQKKLEQALAQEKTRQATAAKEAQEKQKLYLASLQTAQTALAAKNYDQAIGKYQEAGKLFKTDAVLTGMYQAETARAQAAAQAKATQQAELVKKQQAQQVKQLLADGQGALAAKEYARAVAVFAQAKKLSPDNLDALAGLSKAEQLNNQALALARQQSEMADRQKNFQRLLQSAQANYANKHFDAAVASATEALRLQPNDAVAIKLRDQADQARKNLVQDPAKVAEAKKRTEAYQKAMTDGRLALNGKQFDLAAKHFNAAQQLLPGDKASLDFLQEAKKGKDSNTAAALAEAKKRAEAVQRQTAVKKALNDGQAALAAKNLPAAADAIASAAKLAPQDPEVVRAQQDLRRAQYAAQAQIAAQKQRQEQFKTLLKTGQIALGAKNFAEALKAFNQANALVPGDKLAQQGLVQAQKGLAGQPEIDPGKLAEAKKLDNFNALIKQGQAALTAKKYGEAVASFSAAQKLYPTNPTVGPLLQQAQKAANEERIAQELLAKQKTAETKKRDEFNTLLKGGQKALADKKYADAIGAFTAAQKMYPTDPTVGPLLQQAQKAAKAEQNAPELTAKQKAAEAKKLVEFNTLLMSGQNALKAKKYGEAVAAFSAAQKLYPTNPTVEPLLQLAQKAANDERIGQELIAKQKAAETKKLIEFNTLIMSGQNALKAKKYGEAIAAFSAAQKLYPTNPTVGPLLQLAQQAANDERSAQELIAKQKAAEAKKVSDFTNFLKQGQAAMATKKYADAVGAFSAAVKLYPTNPQAQQALREAQQALNPPPPPPAVVAAFNKKMQDALILEKQEKWTDALKLYQEAVKLIPGDAKAKDKLSFALHLTEGQKHLAARRFVEAQREFEAAVALNPSNPTAQLGLKKAKAKMP